MRGRARGRSSSQVSDWSTARPFIPARRTTPVDLDGLVGWWDAESLALSDGDPVTTWPDRVGLRDLAQGTGTKQPTYKTGIRNGRPVVRFDGGDVLVGDVLVASQFTLVVVAAHTSTSGFQATITNGGAASGSGICTNGSTLCPVLPGVNWMTGDTYTANAWYRGVFRGTGTASSWWRDGALVSSPTTTQITPADNLLMGSISAAGAYFLTGDIAEAMLYSRKLSDAEVLSLDTDYLSPRWG